jgi:hypothetical protein
LGAEFAHAQHDRDRQGDAGSPSCADVETPADSLYLGATFDAAEREADRVTADVLRRFSRDQPPAEATVGLAGGPAGSEVEDVVRAERGRGRPLEAAVRRSMESAFGTDLGQVRLHTGPRVTAANDRIMAQAFTLGQDIFFRDGVPDAAAPDGQHVLAHELAHVVQEGGTARRTVRRILQTRLQLETAMGEPKGIGAFGKDAEYRTVIKRLGQYHDLVPKPVREAKFEADVQAMTQAITDIESACDGFTTTNPDDERAPWIADLKAKATAERTLVLTLATDRANLAGKTWAEVLPAIGGERGGLTVAPEAVVDDHLDPGLEGRVSVDTQLREAFDAKTGALSGNATAITKGTAVLIHDTLNPKVVRVEVYNPKGGYGNFTIEGRGYLRPKEVESELRHDSIGKKTPIFTREPNLDDVRQGGIGDCYLVAALGAIVTTNPQFIYDMIKDNGDETVTIRLYAPQTDLSLKLTYVQVQKSLISDNRKSKGAAWVALVEKAYASMGVQRGSKSYAAIGDGGGSDKAFEVLTGRAATATAIVGTELESVPLWSASELKKPVPETRVCQEVFGGNEKLAGTFLEFAARKGVSAQLSSFRSFEEFDQIFHEHNLPSVVTDPLLLILARQFPGLRGSNAYTPRQLDIYARIVDRLHNGGYVAAGTKQKIRPESGGAVGTGTSGEPITEGLAGRHAYTVLQAFARETGTDKPPRKFVRLRNPWGEGTDPKGRGRVYEGGLDGPLTLVTDPQALADLGKAEFDMELTDFTKHFNMLYEA